MADTSPHGWVHGEFRTASHGLCRIACTYILKLKVRRHNSTRTVEESGAVPSEQNRKSYSSCSGSSCSADICSRSSRMWSAQ